MKDPRKAALCQRHLRGLLGRHNDKPWGFFWELWMKYRGQSQ